MKIGLQIKATLENVEELKPSDRDFSWCLKFTCINCGEVSPKWNDVSLSEEVVDQHGKSACNFMMKCKMCARTNSVTILEDSIAPYCSEDEDKFKTIVVFHCRGMEPSNFWPKDGWSAKATNDGNTFTDVDLTEGEWADYCDKTNQPVSISDVQHKFEKVK